MLHHTNTMPRVSLKTNIADLDSEDIQRLQCLFSDLHDRTSDVRGVDDVCTFAVNAAYFAAIKDLALTVFPERTEEATRTRLLVPNSLLRHMVSGFIYLVQTYQSPSLENVGELSIGIILDDRLRNMGVAREAVEQVLEIAFEKLHCQRVQAFVVDSPEKKRSLNLFGKLHFGYEGIRPRSFLTHNMEEWKDTTCLAMLATDWAVRNTIDPVPASAWEELFLRHEAERQELLRYHHELFKVKQRLLCEERSREIEWRNLRLSICHDPVSVDDAADPEYQFSDTDEEDPYLSD